MAADQHQRRLAGIDGLVAMNGAADDSPYPYSGQRDQFQFQQQFQTQQQPMHQMQMHQTQSRAMDSIGPAASTLMQVHSGDTSAGCT